MTKLSAWWPKNWGSIPTPGKTVCSFIEYRWWCQTIFFVMSGMTHQWHIVRSRRLESLKYFLLRMKCLHLLVTLNCVEHYLCSAKCHICQSTTNFPVENLPTCTQALDCDFWTFRGTQVQEGNGSYIDSYIDDDDNDGVKTEMIPVIIGATGTSWRSFRKYLSNVPGKH